MDTVGTFNMAIEMARHGCMVAIHKHYTLDEWRQFERENPSVVGNVCASAGTSKSAVARAWHPPRWQKRCSCTVPGSVRV